MVFVVIVVFVLAVLSVVLHFLTQGSVYWIPTRNPAVGPGRWHDEWGDAWLPVNSAVKGLCSQPRWRWLNDSDYSYWAGGGPVPAGDPYDRVPHPFRE